MAEIDILLQGLREDDDHETAVNELLQIENIDSYLFSLAFVRKAGVERIINNLQNVSDKIDIFIGIRNGITSIQSIFALQKVGIHPYVVDTATNNKIFHPKIYAAYNAEKAHVILGSANLTFGGLNQNIEASSYLVLDLKNEKDDFFIKNLIKTICGMPEKYPDHVFQLTSPKQAVLLLQEGRLEDERITRLPIASSNPSDKERDKLKPIPTFTRHKPSPHKKAKISKSNLVNNNYGILVWESKPLTERSLNIPRGSNTNITGDTNLGKGLMEDIDFQHYFREIVFKELDWNRDLSSRSPYLERAYIDAELIIKNTAYGIFNLEVTHDPRTNTRSYEQNNVMTKIKWGEARHLVAKPDLLERTLQLYKSGHNRFTIVIN